VLLEGLKLAYVRRKRWEAQLQAAEIGRMLGGKPGPGTGGGGIRRVSADDLMARMGATWS